MNAHAVSAAGKSRRSILDLAPLELHCMNALWALGEGSVRDIRAALAPTLPRAYTTIMTIMDRLAHKGVVTRRKVGRAYLYRPSLSAEEARAHAVDQLIAHFFAGSAPALQAHLNGSAELALPRSRQVAAHAAEPPAAYPREEPGPASSAAEGETESTATSIDEVLL
jgi:predicted transcriptional regulator